MRNEAELGQGEIGFHQNDTGRIEVEHIRRRLTIHLPVVMAFDLFCPSIKNRPNHCLFKVGTSSVLAKLRQHRRNAETSGPSTSTVFVAGASRKNNWRSDRRAGPLMGLRTAGFLS